MVCISIAIHHVLTVWRAMFNRIIVSRVKSVIKYTVLSLNGQMQLYNILLR